MNYNAKDEVDGGPPCPPGGTAKTRRPDNTAFKQQRLPAWQPILTAGTVLPTFFIIGLIFIPIGIGIFVTSNNIREIEVSGGEAAAVRVGAAGERCPSFLGSRGSGGPCPSPPSVFLSFLFLFLRVFLNVQLCRRFLSLFIQLGDDCNAECGSGEERPFDGRFVWF